MSRRLKRRWRISDLVGAVPPRQVHHLLPMFRSPPVQQPGSHALRRGRVSVVGQVYHVTSRSLPGESPFNNFRAASAACRAFLDVSKAGRGKLLAWVLMPDHAHWLVELEPDSSLSGFVAALKRRSTSAICKSSRAEAGQTLWMDGFYDRAIRREDDLVSVARYVVANPLRSRIVARLGDYPFWDSVWL